jgi:ABC-type proline/glycine betaine transport system ATPase subunit
MGVLKHKTRILCTHHWKYLHDADVIVVMEHGRVTCIGEPHEVLKEDTLIRKISDSGKWGNHSCPALSLFISMTSSCLRRRCRRHYERRWECWRSR